VAYQFATLQFVAERNGWTKFISMQNKYNLIYREEEREMIPFCKQTGVGLIPWGPIANGLLAHPLGEKTARSTGPQARRFYNTTPLVDEDIIRRAQKVAEDKGWNMSQVALVWAIQKGTVPIVGCSSIERVQDACSVRGKSLTDDELEYLEQAYVPKPISGHS
jgi:aryl-alcohol dehydrogenase-like predicted oxidoreductase